MCGTFHRSRWLITVVTSAARREIERNPASAIIESMPNIVLYEADLLMRTLLREWLSEAGYRVQFPGEREVPSDSRADLVIASVYMPKHTGVQYVRAIRSAHPGAPMIAISGQFRSGMSQDGAAARALGVQQVIAKPLVRTDLLEAVRAMIHPSG
jgi:DNA-binding response OmpR family regulator